MNCKQSTHIKIKTEMNCHSFSRRQVKTRFICSVRLLGALWRTSTDPQLQCEQVDEHKLKEKLELRQKVDELRIFTGRAQKKRNKTSSCLKTLADRKIDASIDIQGLILGHQRKICSH